MVTELDIACWRAKRGLGMVSTVGEYTPEEFWEALDEIERLWRDNLSLKVGLRRTQDKLAAADAINQETK